MGKFAKQITNKKPKIGAKISNKTVLKTSVKKAKNSHVIKLSSLAPTTHHIKRTISKKEKQKLKTQKLKAQIEKTKAAFREEKARQKREKRPIIGDLKPLLDSLPSLDELLTIRDTQRTGIASVDRNITPKLPKNRRKKKEVLNHQKTEQMLDRFDHVNRVWRDPQFQKNPRALIAERIRQRRLEMAGENENM